MEAAVEKMREDQKLLQHMASLTSKLAGKKRERDDYCGEESNDDLSGVEEANKDSARRQKSSQSKKRKVESPSSQKAKSEIQLMKYLQSLQ